MIINSSCDKSSEVSGVKVESFSIKTNAKAFKAIAVNYSDLVKAVLVELGQNAGDSHIRADKEKPGTKNRPFDVILPSLFHPQLIVRDYGTSMTPHFMLNGYKEIFNSTKDKSNNESGAWGVGRLSPFTVSDSYNVNCYKSGTKHSYFIGYDDYGLPQIALLGHSETTEEDGVEVIVNIPSQFISSFRQKAFDAFQLYVTKPNIYIGTKDGEKVHIEDKKFIISKNNPDNTPLWALTGNGQSYAVMGAYSYPINSSNLLGFDSDVYDLLQSGVVIYFKMGELDVTVSRESLEYSTKTSNAIKKIALEIAGSVAEDINNDIKNSSNYFDACLKWYGIIKADKKYVRKNKLVDKYNDIPLQELIKLYIGPGRKPEDPADYTNITLRSYSTNYDKGVFKESELFFSLHISEIIKHNTFVDNHAKQFGNYQHKNNFVIYYYTGEILTRKQIRKKLLNYHHSYLFYFPSEEIKSKFLESTHLSSLQLQNLRDLPDQDTAEIVRTSNPRSEYAIAKVLNINLLPVDLKITPDSTYYYLLVSNKKIRYSRDNKNDVLSTIEDRQVRKIADAFGVPIDNIFLVKTSHAESKGHKELLKTNKNVKHFSEIFNLVENNPEILDLCAAYNCYVNSFDYDTNRFLESLAGLYALASNNYTKDELYCLKNKALIGVLDLFLKKHTAGAKNIDTLLTFIPESIKNSEIKDKTKKYAESITQFYKIAENNGIKLVFDDLSLSPVYRLRDITYTNTILKVADTIFNSYSWENTEQSTKNTQNTPNNA